MLLLFLVTVLIIRVPHSHRVRILAVCGIQYSLAYSAIIDAVCNRGVLQWPLADQMTVLNDRRHIILATDRQ